MEVLVIGGAGQIGQELCQLLQDEDISYRAPSRDLLDLEDHKNVKQLIAEWKPDIVINTAGYRDAGHANYEPSRCYKMNRDCVASLADACNAAGAALIQISSWRVFDGDKKDAFTEKDTPNPKEVLGGSFWLGEQQIHQRCPRHIILRLSWIISSRGYNRVTRLLDSFEEGKPAGTCPNHRGCPTTTEDVARVLLALALQISCDLNVWGTYHYSAAEPIDEYSLAEIVLAEASQYVNIQESQLPVDDSEKEGDTQSEINACLNSTRLQHTFGIMSRPWRSGLARLVRNYYQSKQP
ncbi:NAD(P)-dependent oxidoreductase [Sansalvadorimonas sp. 2012CJ34-2]|uniref:dTDP-4-dehydrorhamnose reductase n=1 Tax=Parendozoicomonas callyspongiae TaxID=2942213 RepID=A0ABT0PD15_9GAMM|nr:sugar nucleotide-binding protein [Sansalvadorimonas sp. 2012CJ34-2]MCL6269116.1 NAD(P)-dependent oxidoreductase [Sansalvadorimonas sp. 2012CJ34-2]